MSKDVTLEIGIDNIALKAGALIGIFVYSIGWSPRLSAFMFVAVYGGALLGTLLAVTLISIAILVIKLYKVCMSYIG